MAEIEPSAGPEHVDTNINPSMGAEDFGAMLMALEEPTLEERWERGDRVFGGIYIDDEATRYNNRMLLRETRNRFSRPFVLELLKMSLRAETQHLEARPTDRREEADQLKAKAAAGEITATDFITTRK